MVGFLSPSHLFSFAPSFTSLFPSLLCFLFFFQHIIAWVSNLWQLLFSHFGIYQWSKQTSLSSPNLFLLGKRHLIKELTHWKRPWCWEGLKDGEEDDRGWDGWMASPTWWTWVWVSSGGWWWTGKPGVLQSMGLQRVRHDWATELNWKHPDSGNGWGQEEKGATEHEISGWHHWLSRHEFEQTLGIKGREAWCATVMGSQGAGHD